MEKLGKKLKHDHTLTSILKFTIFAMVMLAPIFSVASRCLYVICNKNAKDSYSSEGIKQESKLPNGTALIDNVTYIITPTTDTTQTGNWPVYFSSMDLHNENYHVPVGSNVAYFYNSNKNIYFYYWDGTTLSSTDTLVGVWGNQINYVEVIYDNDVRNTATVTSQVNVYQIILKTNKLDNVFEYSLSQLEESSYYNWATNLGIYTPIHNMVSGLGGHDIIALLLAYWSIYTAIYIVFDIIIVCFVKITHLIQGE